MTSARRFAALRVTLGVMHILVGLVLLLPIAAVAGIGSLHALAKLPFSFLLAALLITAFPLWIVFAGIRMLRRLTPRFVRALQVSDSLIVAGALLLCVSGLLALQAAAESAARGGGLLGAYGLIPLALGIALGGLAGVSLWLLRRASRAMPETQSAIAPATIVNIRAATAADAPAVTACVEAAYRPYVARIGREPSPLLADYAEAIRRHRVYVLETDGAIAGSLVVIADDGRALLSTVAVHPSQQRTGYGRKLIAHAENKAAALGFTAMELYTHQLMTENIALYRKLGYTEFDRRTEQGYDRVYMRKPLAPAAA